jgi:hypothetical protein
MEMMQRDTTCTTAFIIPSYSYSSASSWNLEILYLNHVATGLES